MDGCIQNNWLEATVAWWLTAEVSHDKSADCYAIAGLQLPLNKNEKCCLRKHHQELSYLLPQLLSLSAS